MTEVGKFFTQDRNAKEIASGYMEAGPRTYGHVTLYAPDKGENGRLIIGNYCSIALGVTVMLGGNHRTDWVSTYPFALRGRYKKVRTVTQHTITNGDVKIGSDVWLGRDCTIMSGVAICHGAVIATKAVVTKDVGPYEIWGGNPARLIRTRFDQEIIDQLLQIEWWNWPDEEITDVADLLCTSDVNKLLEYAATRS